MRILQSVIAALILLVGAGVLIATAHAADSDKWRINVKSDAESAGDLVFQFHPKGAYPFKVTVQVAEGTKENDVAKRIRDVFQADLPPGGYGVRVDDGEEVEVEAHKGAGHFNLTLVSSTLAGVKIDIEKK